MLWRNEIQMSNPPTGQCAVCGAHVMAKDFNPHVEKQTCDRICKRALYMNRTRGAEIEQEIIASDIAWNERNRLETQFEKLALDDLEDRYYNQPYLYQRFA